MPAGSIYSTEQIQTSLNAPNLFCRALIHKFYRELRSCPSDSRIIHLLTLIWLKCCRCKTLFNQPGNGVKCWPILYVWYPWSSRNEASFFVYHTIRLLTKLTFEVSCCVLKSGCCYIRISALQCDMSYCLIRNAG